MDTLNSSPESPFFRLVKRPSGRAREPDSAVITDTALVEMVRARLHDSGGCLFPYRNVATGETDGENVLRLLVVFWSAVRAVFPDAWGVPPTRSRLMHGAGIKAMGSLMDAIISRLRTSSPSFRADVEAELRRVADGCAWTTGVWKGMGGVPWNSVEDTPRDVRMLSNHLLREYLARANAP